MPKSKKRQPSFLALLRVVGSRPGLPALAAALAMFATLGLATSAEAASARISADGDCLNMRQTPALSGPLVTCVPDGVTVTVTPGTVTADGLDWQLIRTSTAAGWVAARYLTAVPDGTPSTPAPSSPVPQPTAPPSGVPSAPRAFDVPPAGGMTFGVAGTSSPAAVVAAQAFPVAGVSAIEPASQRYLTFIPGAPAIVNTLTDANLRPDMVVMVGRTGTLAPTDTSPLAVTAAPTAAGAGSAFATPARNGLVLGIAGTNDVPTLIKAQPFTVDVVMALDVPTQRWLTYIPGAPEWVSTLNRSTLKATSVVFIRRSASEPDPTPVVKPAPVLTVPVTYYYCTQTASYGAGDGGGFCGAMRNGLVVHQGAASCDRANYGQRFRVVGDPNQLVYTCMDTGGRVSAEHRDIWFATSSEAVAWRQQVAPAGYASIEVVE